MRDYVRARDVARAFAFDFHFGGSMKRQRMSGSHSRSVFRKGAERVHRKNYSQSPMRGGIRL